MKMNTPSVQLVSVRGNHFVIINSMAMEGDGCFLCKEAEGLLKNISCKYVQYYYLDLFK